MFQGLFCKNTKNEVSNGFPAMLRLSNQTKPAEVQLVPRRTPGAAAHKMH
jgi:hypothetical protein